MQSVGTIKNMFGEYGRYETREITTGFMGFEIEITVLFVVLLRVFYETKWGWSTGEFLSTISTSSGIYYLDKFISKLGGSWDPHKEPNKMI